MDVLSILKEIEKLSNQANEIEIQLDSNSSMFRKIFTEANLLGGKIFPLIVKLEESSINEYERELLFKNLNILTEKLNSVAKVCLQIKNKAQ